MSTDEVEAVFDLHNFYPPDPDDGDPLSEELVLPEAVTAAFDLAPTVSVVLENGRLTVLIRRTSRTGTADLVAVVDGGPHPLVIPLTSRGSWLRGAADWPEDRVPSRLRIAVA